MFQLIWITDSWQEKCQNHKTFSSAVNKSMILRRQFKARRVVIYSPDGSIIYQSL